MVALGPSNEHVSRVGGTLTFRYSGSGTTYPGIAVVKFLTRWGTFTEASLNPGWKLIAKFRMAGPWFDGDEVYTIVAAIDASAVVAPATLVVTEHVDADGIPLDAPGIRPMGWRSQWAGSGSGDPYRSVDARSDIITGERSVVHRLFYSMPGDYQNHTDLHIAQRDAACMLDYYSATGVGVEQPLDESRYAKTYTHDWTSASSYDPEDETGWAVAYLRTRSKIKWADGTTEERVRVGADTKIQRIAVQMSTALPTPSKPVIIGGSPQWIDPAAPSTLTLTYAAGLAGDQAKLVWKRTIGAVVDYWNQTTQAWQTGLFENNRSQPNTTFPIGAFPADSTVMLQVATKGVTGGLSEYSDETILDTNPIPTATIGLTPYDIGTEVTTSLSPTVTADGTPAENQTLDGYIVEVLNSDGLRFAYADVAGLSPWVIEPPLPNNTTGWTARVRVRQSGGALSDWVSLPFDVAAVVPGQPTVTVTPTAHETSGLPVQRLTVDLPWETDGFDYVTNPLTLDVDRRVYDVAGEWVRAGSVTPTPGWASNIVLDDEAPSHLPVLYRVRARSTTQYGGELVGAWSAATPGYPIDDGAWLSAPGFPELAVRVDLVTADEGKIVSGQSGTTVIGAPHQVVTGVASVTGDGGYVARTDLPEDEAALVSLLAGGHLLTLSMTPERDSWGDTHAVPRRWFRTVGDVGVARVAQGPWTLRLVSWTATPQAVPATVAGG